MEIEYSPEVYWHSFESYEEAMLYCFQLVIDGKVGWRNPSNEEFDKILKDKEEDSKFRKDKMRNRSSYCCIPVR